MAFERGVLAAVFLMAALPAAYAVGPKGHVATIMFETDSETNNAPLYAHPSFDCTSKKKIIDKFNRIEFWAKNKREFSMTKEVPANAPFTFSIYGRTHVRWDAGMREVFTVCEPILSFTPQAGATYLARHSMNLRGDCALALFRRNGAALTPEPASRLVCPVLNGTPVSQ
ncbi:hypothetical protein IZ6_05370 [Terrihabitans soli]|uniref:Uncharacterized protein n=1 Tax=Terrihabitans soli TaxID=708113 RepID=A0A6S6QRA5_9HYPH|nr:hypothetical protein [Terrihabitans soli]BCJ89802.1 hypothetical protein IZ6_05370 [Terrihabitans soli]